VAERVFVVAEVKGSDVPFRVEWFCFKWDGYFVTLEAQGSVVSVDPADAEGIRVLVSFDALGSTSRAEAVAITRLRDEVAHG
jgi:hypothetical protein